MRRLKNFLQYILIFLITLFILLACTLVFFYVVSVRADSKSAVYARISWLSGQLIRNSMPDESGDGFTMTKEGLEHIDMLEGWAMLLDDGGNVCWEYKLPKDLPRAYSQKDIASFTRWYLDDYPVHTWITDDGIFVLGKPKGSEWIYNIRYASDTLNAYLISLPFLLAVYGIFLFAAPAVIIRSKSRRNERERTAWIAGVSHDIRTPLSIVLGTAAALKEENGDESTAKRAELIEAQALKMRALISNLNTENKLEFGFGSWEKKRFKLTAVVRGVVCELINRQSDTKYCFEVEIDEALEDFTVRADRELVKRMLENLVNNAVNHNPEGCSVKVSMKKGRFPYRCTLIVEDDGCGVDRRRLRVMNRPLDMKALPEHGLGLRLVRHIAGMYHWKVRFREGEAGGLKCLVGIA